MKTEAKAGVMQLAKSTGHAGSNLELRRGGEGILPTPPSLPSRKALGSQISGVGDILVGWNNGVTRRLEPLILPSSPWLLGLYAPLFVLSHKTRWPDECSSVQTALRCP